MRNYRFLYWNLSGNKSFIYKGIVMVDMVNRPPHYIVNGYETIEILKAYFPNDPLMWAAGKYLLRAGRKGDMNLDIDKCIFYLLERKAENNKASEDAVNPPEVEAILERFDDE
jgi:hypothetical protein